MTENSFDFKKQSNLLLIEAFRVAFLVAILVIVLLFQSSQSEFVNVDVWHPVYIMLSTSFLINSVYLIFFDKIYKYSSINAFIFGFDAAVVTGLIYFTGSSQSIFLFLYLVNIILCGLVFQRRGALVLALWTSILLSFLLIFGPPLQGQNLYFSVGLNNLAFFAVAGLSSLLSEQIKFMGSELQARGRDIEALRELNQMIVDNISTGLLSVDVKGMVTHSNRAATKILSDIQLRGKSISKVFPDIADRIDFKKAEQTENMGKRFEIDYYNYRKEKLIIEVILSHLFNADRALSGHVLLFQDLTQIKRLEFNMRQQEKLAAVGQLAAGIAHEIRNPLASISGSVQLLASNGQQHNAEDKKLMTIVLKEIDRLNNLITEFLDFVRPDAQMENPIQINSVVQEVLDIAKLNQKLRKDIKVIAELKSKKIILGNHDRLKQALINIIINAYQAMDKSENPELIVRTQDKLTTVLVMIKDNGLGIEPNQLRRIFEPFHTTKPGGTGLGLAITHKILENHSAQIFVESEPTKGTLFTIEFPAEKVKTEETITLKLKV